MRDFDLQPPPPSEHGRRLRAAAGRIAIHVVLAVLLLCVLFPLLWMLVTAFKQRGRGMELSPIPRTLVTIEAEPIVLAPPGIRVIPVTFELADPGRRWSRVVVAGDFNGWDAGASPLIFREGVWVRTFTDISPGPHPYKFVADGEWMADPGNPTRDADGNSVITIGEEPVFNTSAPADATRIEGGHLVIDYAASGLRGLVAGLRLPEGDWTSTPLTLEGGRWHGELPLPEISGADAVSLPRRYQHRISFSEAWSRTYTLSNFRRILTDPDYPFGRFFLNSLTVAAGSGAVTVILCLLAGYAFAIKHFWGREAIFWILFASMLIPGLVFVLPQFTIVNALGWRNSYQGMILPHVANVFGMFLMRQYIRTLPGDLFAAARVDGATEVQVIRTIVIPLAMPIIVTLFLLTFMAQWSNFLWQLIVNSPDSPLRTLPVGLALFRGQHDVDWELMMAGACFSVVPIAILFIAAQRYFIQGLTAGAVKG